jgi:hypothetical protein
MPPAMLAMTIPTTTTTASTPHPIATLTPVDIPFFAGAADGRSSGDGELGDGISVIGYPC